MIDLRSDTVTLPTPAMRDAMAAAPVGDDVYGDDPTVNALEARTAELLGKEAAVFVPTGTMSNQIGVRAHTEPGDLVLIDRSAHIVRSESGAPAALSGVTLKPLPGRG
ncbi:MAG: beta-eliminating lyase-related protein, partial [Gammaproteobacteria bacterium]|nr:beta-eliminating lyase-related protein [Gammaproteobacteria bacterium]